MGTGEHLTIGDYYRFMCTVMKLVTFIYYSLLHVIFCYVYVSDRWKKKLTGISPVYVINKRELFVYDRFKFYSRIR